MARRPNASPRMQQIAIAANERKTSGLTKRLKGPVVMKAREKGTAQGRSVICRRAGCAGRIRVTFPSTAGKAGPTKLPKVKHGSALVIPETPGRRLRTAPVPSKSSVVKLLPARLTQKPRTRQASCLNPGGWVVSSSRKPYTNDGA